MEVKKHCRWALAFGFSLVLALCLAPQLAWAESSDAATDEDELAIVSVDDTSSADAVADTEGAAVEDEADESPDSSASVDEEAGEADGIANAGSVADAFEVGDGGTLDAADELVVSAADTTESAAQLEAAAATQAEEEGWHSEKLSSGTTAYYYVKNSSRQTGWLITASASPLGGTSSGLQRYFLLGSGYLAVDLLVTPDNGAGYYAYATKYGYVVRGVYDAGNGYVYLADNDGKLETVSGWLVTGAYTNGELQRYYIDGDKHAAKTSYFTVDGAHYFGQGGKGYVLRGAGSGYNSKSQSATLYASNDGKLATSQWVCTDAFGQGLQRYWFDSTSAMAKSRVILASEEGSGYDAYATSEGYVLRGALDSGAGYVYLADNDGRLASGSGWLVTGIYTGGSLQRYYLITKNSVSVARTSYFEVEGAAYYGLGGVGYVLRGAGSGYNSKSQSSTLYASNDGKLATSQWVCTDAFGQGLQRYWFDSTSAMAKGRLIDPVNNTLDKGAYYAYATSEGYVLRGTLDSGAGYVYLADNDGKLLGSNMTSDDWVVTGAYTGGVLQRYYVSASLHAARSGFFVVAGYGSVYGLGGVGYVLRGKSAWGSHMMVADNDGKLHDSAGWYVGTDYDSEIQRYYFELVPDIGTYYGAIIGQFSVGSATYYGRSDQGYVVRGYYEDAAGNLYYSDGDGVAAVIAGAVLQGAAYSPYIQSAYNIIWNSSSDTQYIIALDADNCHLVIFQGSAYNWVPIYEWLAGTGLSQYNSGNGTPRGWYQIGQSGCSYDWAVGGNGGYRTSYYAKDDIKYFTAFVLDCGFHSTIGWDGGYSDPNQIGKKISHGCVRLLEENAKWIYYNCLVGTTVVVYPD